MREVHDGGAHHPEGRAKRGPALLVDRAFQVSGDVRALDRVEANLKTNGSGEEREHDRSDGGLKERLQKVRRLSGER